MLLRTGTSNRTRGSCGCVALWAACILAISAVHASAQQGGGGGGMCQGGGGGGGGGGTAGGGTTTGTAAAAGLTALSFRGGTGTAGTATVNPVASAMMSMQAHSNQFRQAQLNAVAANAQLRADTQAMWASARERKQQALAMRERTLAARNKNP